MRERQARAVDSRSVELPPEAARRLGLAPGARLDLVLRRGRVEVLPDIHSLSRVYIEPTSRCNLTCRTCIQRTWDEPQGEMSHVVFDRLINDLGRFPHLESVMFGGFGEPLAHPEIISMVAAVKKAGLRAELVSNGTLLGAITADGLLKAGLDRLWISFDGAEEANFEDNRRGARFKEVLGNIRRLRGELELGLAFVVTRSNLADLGTLDRLAKRTGAAFISVSNVIPYAPEMEKQMVCTSAMRTGAMSREGAGAAVDLPRLDVNDYTREALWRLSGGNAAVSIMGSPVGAPTDECRFIRERCTFIRWDGRVAPCMALLHSHVIYFNGGERRNKSHSFGSVAETGLRDLWDSGEYSLFREKVAEFDFSPCHACGGCGFSGDNAEDCGGNKFPASCGGCLWAQGVIQCP